MRRISHHRVRGICAILIVALVGCKGHSVAESMQIASQKRQQGDFKAVMIELKNVLQQDTSNQEARLMLAETFLDGGQGSEAELELRRLADAGMDERRTRVLMARALLLQGNYNRVISEIRPTGEADAKTNSQVREIRGESFIALGRLPDASKEFAQSLVDDPGNPLAMVGNAQVALISGDYDGSLRLVNEVLIGHPDDTRALLLKGDLQRYGGKRDEALATYAKVLALHPANILALSTTAYLHIIGGEHEAAAKDIAKIREFRNGIAPANYLEALLEYQEKRYSVARNLIQKALATQPEHLPSVMLGGAIEYQLGAYEQAERYLRQVLAASPTTIFNRQVLAMTLMKENRGAEAAEILAPTLQVTNDPNVWVLAGNAYAQAKQYGRATEAFAHASTLQPSDAAGKLRLGVSRLANGDANRALADFEAAVELKPDDALADFALVVTRIRRGDYDAALEAARAMQQRLPTNPIGFNLEGGTYLAKGDIPRARTAFEKALAIEPDFVPPAMNLARLDLMDKKPDAAKGRFASMVSREPVNVEALVAYANLLRELNTPRAEIVALLEKARAADPKAIDPRLMLVQLLVVSDPKRAFALAQEALAIDRSNTASLEALGVAQAANNELSASMATFRHLVELRPDAPAARVHLAELYLQSGNAVAATRELRSALEIAPDYRDAQLLLVGLEAQSGRRAEALRLAQKIQKANPKLVMGYILEGDVQIAAKNGQQAAAAYEKAFEINRSAPLLLKLHSAYVMAGRSNEADARLNRWLADHPDDTDIRYYYANYLMRNGQTRAATMQLQAVVAKQPQHVFALNDLAWLQGQAKDPSAVDTARRAHDLLPNDVHVADTYGTLLFELGRTQEAIDVFRPAMEASPNAYELRLRLARAYLRAGDIVKARQQLEFVANAGNSTKLRTAASTELQQLDR